MTSALEGMHAIGYCRVSTDPEDKGQTVETQKRQINEWAERYGVEIDDIYADEGISGGTWPRPMLSMAIMSLVNSPASFLVCYDQSRLTRDAPAHLSQIKKALQGKVIRYVTDGDTDPDNLGIRIVSAIKAETDKEERRVLHDKRHYRGERVIGIKYPCNTKRGYLIANVGDGLVMNRPHRARGTVQAELCPTICCCYGGVRNCG